MGRLLQEKIKQPLADELLFGKLTAGGEVHVSIRDGKPSFEVMPAPPKVSPKKLTRAQDGGRGKRRLRTSDSDSELKIGSSKNKKIKQ